MSDIRRAVEIAKNNLRSCYTEDGILTGSRKVYWSWDSFFASFGALEINDHEIVKKNLELYLRYQNKEGNIPKRIANPFYPLRYLKIPISESSQKQKPSFASPYYTGISISQCPVFIICCYQYFKKTGDLDFLKSNYKKLQKMDNFLDKKTYRNGLLNEAIGGGWAESVLKRGAVAYTNACYAESLNCMSKIAKIVGNKTDTKKFKNKYKLTKKTINAKLWESSSGGYYSDWYGLSRHHYFNSDGNLFAILWDIADKNQADQINSQIDLLIKESDPPLPLTSDRYYFWRIFLANQLAGIKNYHVRYSWLWLGCLAALVKLKIGDRKSAVNILESIARVIVREKSIHEIYRKGRPVHLPLYKSETPWAWGAGLFIYACKEAGFRVR